MPSKDKVAITVRLEPKLARRVKKLAKKAGRSTSSMIAWILEDRIAIEESHVNAIEEGIAAAERGEFVDLDAVVSELERKYARKNNRARSA